MPSVDRRAIHPIRKLVQRLESLERAGVAHLKRTAASAALSSSDQASPPEAAPMEPPADDRVAALAAVARRVAACTRCAELACSRTQTVFGVGNPHCAAGFSRRGPRGRRRSPRRTLRRQGRPIADRHHRQGDENAAGGRIHLQHPPLPAPGESHPPAGRGRGLPRVSRRPIGHHPAGVHLLSWGLRRAKSAPNRAFRSANCGVDFTISAGSRSFARIIPPMSCGIRPPSGKFGTTSSCSWPKWGFSRRSGAHPPGPTRGTVPLGVLGACKTAANIGD